MSEMHDRLAPLVGEWNLEMTWEGRVVARPRATTEWIEDGRFLVQRSSTSVAGDAPQAWQDNAPRSATAVMGADGRSDTYSYAYADSRDVQRSYEMTFDGREWRIHGQAGPEFFQRFVGILSGDGNRIETRWERSTDGRSWELDFEATYRRGGV